MLLNPHVTNIHLPAHALGILGVVLIYMNPSWMTLVGFLIANFWYSCLGMSIGFHRYFAHKAFTTNQFWRWVMLLGGSFAGQGSVVFWVALHRLHHPTSDRPGDIHSPQEGFWHSYMGWILTLDPSKVSLNRAIDLIKDPAAKWTHRNYTILVWSWWLFLLAISLIFPAFIAGVLIAGVWSIHQEAFINSICHHESFGIAPNQTKDYSRNVKWLSWLTWGQSLHNTHHAYPASSNFGLDGNFDPGYYIIRKIEL